MRTYNVAEEFTEDLGHRFYTDGDHSGQEFREEVLEGLVARAIDANEPVLINFDGVYGMPPSFVEEAFGGLRRKRPEWNAADLARLVHIEAKDSPKLWAWVAYARAALTQGKPRPPRA